MVTDSTKIRKSLLSVYKKRGMSCKYENPSMLHGVMRIYQEANHKSGNVITDITFDNKSNICIISHNNGESWSSKSSRFKSSEEFLSLYDKTIEDMLGDKPNTKEE